MFFDLEIKCAVTYQVIDTECGCVKLSANRQKFVHILRNDFESGILLLAENIFSIERILLRIPAYLSDIHRRKAIIIITNTTDTEFKKHSEDILFKIYEQVRLANVMLITPCQKDPEVSMKIISHS